MNLFKSSFKSGAASVLCGLALAAGVSTAAQAATVSEGVATIPGTWLFDFDAGSLVGVPSSSQADVWWEQMTTTSRQLMPYATAGIAYVGQVGVGGLSFNALTANDLAALTYSSNGIPGGDAVNMLTPNSVFAVKTTEGNYTKALVTFPFSQSYENNGLGVYWVTMTAPVPEPGSYAMLLAGLGLLGAVARRRTA